jgi:hypothetical protein
MNEQSNQVIEESRASDPNDAGTRKLFSITLAMVAFILAFMLGFLGLAFSGAGHGSGVFGYLFLSPVVGFPGHHFVLGLVLWPAIGGLIPWARNLIVSGIVLLLLAFTYWGIMKDMSADIKEEGTGYALKVMDAFPDLVWLIISMFGLVQIAIWGSLIYLRASKIRKA